MLQRSINGLMIYNGERMTISRGNLVLSSWIKMNVITSTVFANKRSERKLRRIV